jgi:hypothetical protein
VIAVRHRPEYCHVLSDYRVWVGNRIYCTHIQPGITSNYNAAQITIIYTSLFSLLQPPLVVAWLQSSNRAIPHALTAQKLHSLTADSILYYSAHGFLVKAKDLLSHTASSKGLQLYNLGADRTENISPQFLYSCISFVVGVTSCYVTFTRPFPSNGRLCWLQNSGFEPSCHNTIRLSFSAGL